MLHLKLIVVLPGKTFSRVLKTYTFPITAREHHHISFEVTLKSSFVSMCCCPNGFSIQIAGKFAGFTYTRYDVNEKNINDIINENS
jgi:hypothetical protein